MKPRSPRLAGSLLVRSQPGAAVYLDGSSRGTADANGQLAITEVSAGAHQLRVSAPGKSDYNQSITVQAGQEASVAAELTVLGGTVLFRTSPGATVFVDNSNRGTTDLSGQLTLTDVAPGAHALRISAPGKVEYRQSLTVAAGEPAKVEVSLADLGAASQGATRVNPKDGLKYVWIPPGTFQMGCSPGDAMCSPSEKPAHPVTITKGFWMGQTEVTVGVYKKFATATFRKMPLPVAFNPQWSIDNIPIVEVTWDGADNYCTWAGGRLPTEAEWEYAARGGSTASRYGELDVVAWYRENSDAKAHPVGEKQVNGFGLFDMLGNVSEWVHDHYDANYYQTSPAQDPEGPSSGNFRVLRGLGWDDVHRLVRVSQRQFSEPSAKLADGGFRCVGNTLGP